MHVFLLLSTKIFLNKFTRTEKFFKKKFWVLKNFLYSQARLDVGSSSKAPGSGSARARKFQARSTPIWLFPLLSALARFFSNRLFLPLFLPSFLSQLLERNEKGKDGWRERAKSGGFKREGSRRAARQERPRRKRRTFNFRSTWHKYVLNY